MQQSIRLRYFLQVAFTAIVYFTLARLSLYFQFENSNATPVWPPSGFAFAAVLMWGYRVAPGIFTGAFLANLLIFISNRTVDYPLAVALSAIIGTGNMTEALVGSFLLRRFIPAFHVHSFLRKASHIIYFTITAALMSVISSLIGTLTVSTANIIQPSDFPVVLVTWWLGDFSGILLVTSLILSWLAYYKNNEIRRVSPKRTLFEYLFLSLCLFVVIGAVFLDWFKPFNFFSYAYWTIPFFAWAALRFGQHETVSVIAVCAFISMIGTIEHKGTFGSLPLNEALISLQAFISIMVITKLAMNMTVMERRETELALRNTGVELEKRVKTRTAELVEREHELREQKAFAELLIENSPYLILAYDKEMKITAWNKKSEEHSGLKKEEVIGKHIFSVFPQYDDEWKSQMKQVLEEGKSLHFPKFGFLHRPGWGESFVTPLVNSKNEIIGLLSITRDISDLVEMTDDLEQKNMALQKTNAELSSFAYVASHDLQEPLRKIQMFSNRILETEYDQLSDHSRDYFMRMKNAAHRMQQLIEDLLTYSRTSNMERNFEKVHLSQLVNEAREDLKDEFQHKEPIIEANDLCECNVIPFQFRQLLYNLFSNSIKFAKPEERPHIEIKSRIISGNELKHLGLDPEKDYCHITVKDEGIGFEPEFNVQIFGLFQRLHGKTEYPGTGIGLAICKKIVENHHGKITAQGEPGRGATFDIYIPNLQNSGST